MLKTVRSYYNYWFMIAPNFSFVRALIFDLDGTLIDSRRDLIRSVSATLREMGREELHEDTLSGYIGHGALQLVGRALRSEEHTSELQSQSNLVCRLLLEKKNTPLRFALISLQTI